VRANLAFEHCWVMNWVQRRRVGLDACRRKVDLESLDERARQSHYVYTTSGLTYRRRLHHASPTTPFETERSG